MPPQLTRRGESFKAERRKMIEQAMEWKAPKMYNELKKTGELQEVLALKEEAMMDEYRTVERQILEASYEEKNALADPIKHNQKIEMELRRAWEITMADHLEFYDDGDGPPTTIFDLME
jgi:hypothetical protein